MKKLFTFLFLCSILSVSWSQDHTVETVGSTAFSPTDLVVSLGQTVEWVNTGGSHNVNGTQTTYPDNPESFGNAVSTGWTFQHTFNTKGFYEYRCDPHVNLGMIGTVTVLGPQYPIGLITADNDGNGEADSVGVECSITGVVYGVDLRGGTGLQFTIIDNNNDGIQIFSFDDVAGYVVAEGDEITVDGTVDSFNGQAQFEPDTIIVNSSGNALVTATDVTALDESTESQLVRLVNVSLANPTQWTGSGSFNVDVTDGTNTYVVRLEESVDLSSATAPFGLFNLTGIGGQFDGTDPFTDGYQIFPRYTADLELTGSALMIAGVVDPQGGNGSGNNTAGPKAIELYALQDIPDLSVYGVGAANNGGGSDGIEFTFPADAIAAGTCITYTDSVNVDNFANFFGFSADYLVPAGGFSASGVNGDDAIELFENGVVIDVFGDPSVDGSGEVWEYTDGWAYRKNMMMANGGNFNPDNWNYSGVDALQDDNFTTNAQFANPFPNCTYSLVPPPNYSLATIGAVTADLDGNAIPDSLDALVEITGVVYGIDYRGTDGYSFTIIGSDDEGINVFSFDDVDSYVVTEGDEITVQGEIIQFNGLTEISPDNITLNSQGNTLNAATDVTNLDESTESQFIRMVNMTLVDPSQWNLLGGSFNVDITDGTNTFVMRIDDDTDVSGSAAPTGVFNVTGIGGQFDGSDPFDEGYQIFPRYTTDIEEVISTNDLELGSQIKFHPNPVSELLQIRSEIRLDQIRISNMLGQQLQVMNRPDTNEFVNVSNWQSGIYAITFISKNRIYTAQFVKK
ncbi:MAG: plastocyanin/azurin family copper-binding protein [Bacteroidota bacterium]